MAATTRRRDGHLARERMLEEAMTAIAEDGLAGLTMSALAKRLGTSGGHILYYFGTIEVVARGREAGAACPDCGRFSDRVHDRY
ncbi:helix-turn-helix domain-containing protein, partial [Streptomyces sp. NPDC002346]